MSRTEKITAAELRAGDTITFRPDDLADTLAAATVTASERVASADPGGYSVSLTFRGHDGREYPAILPPFVFVHRIVPDLVAYAVQAVCDGRQVPTFYLLADVQGIVSEDHARRIAADILGVAESRLFVSAVRTTLP